jgi:hypothetical protein
MLKRGKSIKDFHYDKLSCSSKKCAGIFSDFNVYEAFQLVHLLKDCSVEGAMFTTVIA